MAEVTDGRRVVQASEILDKIQKGEPVEYDGVIIEGDLDLSKLDLPKENENFLVNSNIIIRKSRIKGDVIFANTIFKRAIIFESTQFDRIAIFQAQFRGIAYFNYAQFSRDADFSRAVFTRLATFLGAMFKGNVHFEDATFSENAYFNDAAFRENADFTHATFSRYAEFLSAIFSRDAYFNHVTFSGDADINHATFRGYAAFKESRFNENAAFNKATFIKDARFEGATFSGSANFWRATFGKDAYFEGATFEHELNIQDVALKNPKTRQFLFSIARERAENDNNLASAEEYYYQEQISRQELKPTYAKYIEKLFVQYLIGYGAKPFRALASWLIIIVGFSVIYYHGGAIDIYDTFYEYVFYSITSAAIPGYVTYHPKVGIYQCIAVFEAIIGAFLWAVIATNFSKLNISLGKILGLWLSLIIVFSLIYWTRNGLEDATAPVEYLYFSTISAVTPGYGGYQLKSELFVFSAIEAILGTFMWAAFIATFARKYMR